ncbi:PUA-like domain-containing protein [Aspergillus multicolor]|uniref:PUA-like domain-containing protein n=1 Tax=Aspergillus multicolor TaxID=41759 RepID=UPI003CCE4672
MSLSKSPSISSNGHCDVILPMQDPYMDQIINGTKNYEFRKYLLKPSVKRIWFYRTAPHSAITHVCETRPARTRNADDSPLDEGGLGNAKFNKHAKDWEGYDFAYKIDSVYELREPITLEELKGKHGFKSAPRGRVYLPLSISKSADWKKQKLILKRD